MTQFAIADPESEMLDHISKTAVDSARQNSTGPGGMLGGMLGGGYAKTEMQQAVTLSSLWGRLQASIDHVDTLIKGANASVSLLVGPQPVEGRATNSKVPSPDEGALDLADRLLNVLGARLGELQHLNDTIARRLS